jgi:thiol-disulfide isomerase/thioredoxin
MKKAFLFLLVLSNCICFSQQYDFVPKSYVAVDKWKFVDLLNKSPKPEVDYRLENGKNYTQAYLDSIKNTKDSSRLSTIYLSDSIANKVTVILKIRTDDELRQADKEFFDMQKKEKSNRKKMVGNTISNLKLTDILGKQYTSETLLGKMVFLNFWFTKCAPCIEEMPDLNKLKEKYGTADVVYFAITYDKIELVEKFLNRQRLDFTVIPNDRKTINAMDVCFYPTNILLDQKGKVLFVNELFNPRSNNGIDEIGKLIKKHTKKT